MSDPQVQVDHPETMNLLGLMLGSILRRNMLRGARRPRRGVLGVTAGPMNCSVEFSPEGVLIRRDRPARAKARLKADLETLIQIAQAPVRASAVAMTRGRMRISGNPIFLASMLPLFRA